MAEALPSPFKAPSVESKALTVDLQVSGASRNGAIQYTYSPKTAD